MSEKTMPSYTIRTMQLSDSEEVRELWSALEWDIYKYSNEMMLINDPNGVFVAQENATGKLLGVCGCVNLSPELSFVCMYAVREDCQGLGIGTALWAKGIEHMGDRNASLFAANVKMQEIYKNHHNFKAIPQRKRLLMKGKPVVNALTASISGICLVDMNDKNIADVIEYDKQVCDGVDRSAALRALNGTFDNINSVAINDNNQVMGYCVVSETVSGYPLIAPLYADNQQIAELLIRNCLQRIHNWETKEIYYSCWDSNHKSMEIANKLGIKQFLKLPIMFTKKILDGQLHKIYSLGLSVMYPF